MFANSSRGAVRPTRILLIYFATNLAFLSLMRIGLSLWKFDRFASSEDLLTSLTYGLRFDLITLCLLFLVPGVVLINTAQWKISSRYVSRLAGVMLLLASLAVVFMELSTPSFIDQFDTRPNRLFFEYLDTPVIAFMTAVREYPLGSVATLILLVFAFLFLRRINRRYLDDIKPLAVRYRLLLTPIFVILMIMGIRSSFDHRPANPSTAAFSNDQLVNKISLNSLYTLLYAAYSLRHESEQSDIYGKMETENVLRGVDESRLQSATPQRVFRHAEPGVVPSSPKNIVILLQESLSASFVGRLGGLGVTPELDRLSQQGLLLTNLYSTGTRSARGIEAVVSGFPPSPSRSVLKLGLSQQNFFTIAAFLREKGYSAEFIYGGETHFDNMAGFFLGNGFDRVIGENDYPNPAFRGSWGVSDEDLYQRVDQALATDPDKPKFILAFTSSNHTPFEYPQGRIELHEQPANTVNNAVKYADYALGQFFRTAMSRPYWDNSYFLVVSDHNSHVGGAAENKGKLIPVDKFHIPGLFLGADIKPGVFEPVASQIDLAPTLLTMAGFLDDPKQTPMPGTALQYFPQGDPGRALLQFGDIHGYLRGDKLVVHQPYLDAQQFRYVDGKLVEQPADSDLIQQADAWAAWPSLMYREQRYHLVGADALASD